MLAHQGGWDELALVLAPLVIIGALLWLVRRRVEAEAARNRAGADEHAE